MANKGDAPHFRGIPPKQAHEIKRDRAIIELQVHGRKFTRELEQVKGFGQQNPYHKGYDVNPIDIMYLSPHEDIDDEERRAGIRRQPGDDLKGLQVQALKLNSQNYLDWMQAIKMIFELNEYNEEKSFKLAILKLKGYDSLLSI